jgi:hypothetical protein
MGMMMGSAPASHLAVGAILRTAMSATAGVAFAVALAVLIRAGFGLLATPVGYVLGGAAGGALLYVIMVYADPRRRQRSRRKPGHHRRRKALLRSQPAAV